MSRPLLLLAAALAAGTWLGQDCSLTQAGGLLIMAALAGVLALAAPDRAAPLAVAAAAVALGAGAMGVERSAYSRAPLRQWVASGPVRPLPWSFRAWPFATGGWPATA